MELVVRDKMKQTFITLGLAALLGGCAPAYVVKEEAPVRTVNNSPAAEMAVDADVTERTPYLTPFIQFFHSLDPETSLVVTYTTSHPLIIQNVQAKAMVIPEGLPELYAKMGRIGAFSEKEALQTYTCQGRVR